MKPLLRTKELLFVVVDNHKGLMSAVEGNYGIVAFGENMEDLKNVIVLKVRQFFNGHFKGIIRIRQFSDHIVRI
ncbi:hypothetical protein [Parapedobacter tibetensis]|uniref:hypothetical protein n=1 Tax=Parapedobacter tibetensis TaxID=2972951 RepID=UPI00214DB56E|nr:hypothetical protein [Parapedobacter tibetensis]